MTFATSTKIQTVLFLVEKFIKPVKPVNLPYISISLNVALQKVQKLKQS